MLCTISVLPLVAVLGVFTPRNHVRTSKKMAVQMSPDILKFMRTHAGKTRDIPIFVNPPVIFSNTGKIA